MFIARRICMIAAVALLLMSCAYASSFVPIDVTANVQVWTGAINETADLAHQPAGTPSFAFTYTGLMDFVNNCPSSNSASCNTFQLFGFSSSNTSVFTQGSQGTFLSSVMSLPGTSVASYLLFTFNLNIAAGTAGQISHDDGATIYGVGGSGDLLGGSAPITGLQTNNFTYDGSGTYQIAYVEANGSPSDLIVTAQTPEPSSLVLFGSGLAGLAGLVRRKMVR